MNVNNFNSNNLPQVIDGNNNPFEIFNYLDKGGVRTIRDNYGNPWFCLNDICVILEIKEPHRVASRIPDPYRTSMTVWVQTGVKADGSPAIRNTNMNFVNETGLYYAIGRSTKPEAEKFREWLYSEVIPSIRQNGYYINPYGNMNQSLGYGIQQIGIAITKLEERTDSLDNRVIYLEEFNNQGYYTIVQFLAHYGFDVNLVDLDKMKKMLLETCRKSNIAIAKVYSGNMTGELMFPYGILVNVSVAMGLGSN